MTRRATVVCGLPGSGKTTMLAALWHTVSARERPAFLELDTLLGVDSTYLNEIASRWRSAEPQEHTPAASHRVVDMQLRDSSQRRLRLTFPDLSGESYRALWEDRACARSLVDLANNCGSLALLIHADKIVRPLWAADITSLNRMLGLPSSDPIAWSSAAAPTQVQLVEILQLLQHPLVGARWSRVAIILSAWDTVSSGDTPDGFLHQNLPLLAQFLEGMPADVRVLGVSAQGGDYQSRPIADALTEQDVQVDRIRVIGGGFDGWDLTRPIAWLVGFGDGDD